jgi:hypothetical protein
MKNVCFTKVPSRSLANLHVATVDGVEVGFCYKPDASRGERNAWRSYVGIGDQARFLYHTWDRRDAMMAITASVN